MFCRLYDRILPSAGHFVIYSGIKLLFIWVVIVVVSLCMYVCIIIIIIIRGIWLLEFFIELILPSSLWSCGRLSL